MTRARFEVRPFPPERHDVVDALEVGADARQLIREPRGLQGNGSPSWRPSLNKMAMCEDASLREFVDIWYSAHTWEQLKNMEIRA